MKKIISSILVIMVSFFMVSNVSAKITKPKLDESKDPINIYIFRGDGCGYCHQALEYFESIDDEYGDYFNLIGYEVSTANNQELWQKVADHFGDEVGSIPYIVVGDAYHKTGFQESIGEEIIKIALEQYKSDKYVDVVDQIAKENSFDKETEYSQNSEFNVLTNAEVSNGAKDEKSSATDTVIVIGIFVVVIAGIGGLVYASKKQ